MSNADKTIVVGDGSTASVQGAIVLGENITASSPCIYVGTASAPLTTSTSATGGSAVAQPNLPVGYICVFVNGTQRKIAFFDP